MVGPTMDLQAWLRKQLEEADSDLLREMVQTFSEALMDAEVDSICNATYGERTSARTNSRNGHRTRTWDTRAGTIELPIPKLRAGSYFPDWLLENRRRAAGHGRGRGRVLRQRSLDQTGRRAREDLGDRQDLQVAGLGHGQEPR